jgi:hypothetical protein
MGTIFIPSPPLGERVRVRGKLISFSLGLIISAFHPFAPKVRLNGTETLN